MTNESGIAVPKGLDYYLPTVGYTRRSSTDTLVIHCADTPATLDASAAVIRGWHVRERGFKDIGYHLVIRRDGSMELGRPIWSVGAHVEGHNQTSIGVCMVGGCNAKGEEENNFTQAQWDTLVCKAVQLVREFTITKVCGHRDFPNVKKYCPSFDVATWLKQHKNAFV